MKLHLKKPGKKIILVSSVVALGLVGGISAQVANKPNAEAGTSPLIQTVDKQGTELDNHEARITNTESDVKDLQSKTNTTPSTVKVPVPVVVTQPSDTSPVAVTPTPVTVTAYQEIVIDPDTSDCLYTYSDGTTYQFHWKTTDPHGAWTTDSVGQNGHWNSATTRNGFCDQNAVGQLKVN